LFLFGEVLEQIHLHRLETSALDGAVVSSTHCDGADSPLRGGDRSPISHEPPINRVRLWAFGLEQQGHARREPDLRDADGHASIAPHLAFVVLHVLVLVQPPRGRRVERASFTKNRRPQLPTRVDRVAIHLGEDVLVLAQTLGSTTQISTNCDEKVSLSGDGLPPLLL
jgi:hypothetical protein